MSRLNARIAKLEAAAGLMTTLRPMVLIGRYAGMTEDDAVARWEATNGPVGDRDIVMLCGAAASLGNAPS